LCLAHAASGRAHAQPTLLLSRATTQCGFSNTCVQVLNQCAVPYETVNILEDEALRSGMKEYSAWPTFPQLYVGGSFYGGCDITVAAFQDGSLKEALEKTINS
jgi:monothiol glutaredoxin